MHRNPVIPGEIVLIVARKIGPRHADPGAVIQLDVVERDVAKIAYPVDLPAREIMAFGGILCSSTYRLAFAGNVEIDFLGPQRDEHFRAVRSGNPVVEEHLADARTF